ncbi:MAG: hypothetical protein JNN30_08840 [Rhodanobacteraceae bacterium]|nr:hypothetical protein [Rhodanobacteraceae bacterium]
MRCSRTLLVLSVALITAAAGASPPEPPGARLDVSLALGLMPAAAPLKPMLTQSAVAAPSSPPICPAYDASKFGSGLATQPVSGAVAMPLRGSFTVGGDGAAHYSLALEAVPGPAGMTPDLSLDYSSTQGNGYVGVGFSLSGVTAISRCAKTIADDGKVQAVSLTSADKLCLGSLSLVAQSGNYGEPGTVYRTDPETFAKVTAVGGSSSSGATSFEMRTKDGLIHTYGDVSGGQDTDFIGSKRVSWPLTATRDRLGNTVRYRYINILGDDANGQPYSQERRLDEIQYGTFSGTTPDRRIKFTYEIRPDRSEQYANGVALVLSRRLSKIEMQRQIGTGYSTARSYTLGYENEGPTARSKLISVKACGTSDSACLPATTFTWYRGGDGFDLSVAQDGLLAPPSIHTPLVSIDLLGTGTPNLGYHYDANGDAEGGGTWRFFATNPDHIPGHPWHEGNFTVDSAIAEPTPVFGARVIDYDLDGIEDLLPIDSVKGTGPHYAGVTNWRPLLSRIVGPVPVNTVFSGGLNQVNGDGFFADLDGDGFQDTLQFFPAAAFASPPVDNDQWRYSLRSGTVSSALHADFPAPSATDSQAFGPAVKIDALDYKAASAVFVLDRDGDGKDDIFYRDGTELKALEIPSAVNSTGLPSWILNQNVKRLFVDFNGDGLIDILTNVGTEPESQTVSSAGRLYLWQSTGRRFLAVRQVFANTEAAKFDYGHALVVDVNSDGRSDLLVPNTRKVLSDDFESFPKADALHLLKAPTSDSGTAQFTFTANKIPFTFENKERAPDSNPPKYVEFYTHEMISDYLSNQGPRVIDADGDGLVDLVSVAISYDDDAHPNRSTRKIRYRPHAKANEMPDRLAEIHEGINQSIPTVAISYTPMSGHPEVYQRGHCDRALYNCAINPYPVVSRVERDAGLNGLASSTKLVSTYSYKNSITHKKARRWLGFAEQRIQTQPSDNSQAPVVTRNFYSNSDEQHDPLLRESWSYSTLPDGQRWFERTLQNWQPRDTVLANGKVLTYHYVERNESWSYRFPSTVNADALTPGLLDEPFANLLQYRHHNVLHNQVMSLDGYGNVTQSRSFVGPGESKTTTETIYLPADETAWLVSRPEFVHTYQVAANCGSESECRSASERSVQIKAYLKTASGAPTALPQTVRQYHSDAAPGQETQTQLNYDAYGNVTYTATTGAIDAVGTQGTRESCATYDPDGVFVHAVSNALTHTAYSKYDPLLGVPLDSIDANGRHTLSQYDQLGRLIKVRAPSGAEINVSYNATLSTGAAPLTWLTQIESSDATGRRDRTLYDRLGRPLKRSFKGYDGNLRETNQEFNAVGTLKRQDALAARPGSAVPQIEYTYDTRGRKLTQSEPNELDPAHPYQRTWEYSDDAASKVTYTDTRGHVTVQEFGNSGELGRSIEAYNTADQVTRQFVYGPYGRPKSSEVVGTPGTLSEVTYDDRGNKLTLTDPDRGLTSNVYNAFNELILSTDANGRQTRPVYDVLGRVDQVTVSQGSGATAKTLSFTDYTYDVEQASHDSELGVLTRLRRDDYFLGGAAQTTQVDYDYDDALGRLQDVTHSVPSDLTQGVTSSYRFHYDYDEFGRLRTVQYPRLSGQTTADAGLSIDYDYAGTNGQLSTIKSRQSGVTNGNLTLWALNETDAANRPRLSTTGEGISKVRQYDWRGAVASQLLQTSPNDACPSCTRGELIYVYDGQGNLLSRTDDTQGTSGSVTELFDYDAHDRLTTMSMTTLATPLETWRYDPLGNVQFNTYRGNYTYGDPLRPMRVTQVAGGTLGGTRSYGYDAVGNQTTRPAGTVTYNERNLPVQLLNSAGKPMATFLYGPAGNRVRKTTGIGSSLITTTSLAGLYEQIRRGTQLEHRFLVPGVASLPYLESGGVVTKQAPLFLHSDHLGSVDTVTSDDDAGTGVKAVIKERRSYDAFGLKRNPSWLNNSYTGMQPALVNEGYTGHNDDPELGLIDMKGRIYDPTLLRFLTPDPLVSNMSSTQAWNPYAYVRNNPLSNTDPTGLRDCVAKRTSTGGQWVCGSGGGGASDPIGQPIQGSVYGDGEPGSPDNGPQRAATWSEIREEILEQFDERPVVAYGASVVNNFVRNGIRVAQNTLPGQTATDATAGPSPPVITTLPDGYTVTSQDVDGNIHSEVMIVSDLGDARRAWVTLPPTPEQITRIENESFLFAAQTFFAWAMGMSAPSTRGSSGVNGSSGAKPQMGGGSTRRLRTGIVGGGGDGGGGKRRIIVRTFPEPPPKLIPGTNKSGQLTSRSTFQNGTVVDAWDSARPGPNGGRLCPTCSAEVKGDPRTGAPRDWDVSHSPSWVNRLFRHDATRQEVIDNYQEGVKLECAHCNRSRQDNDD